MKKAYALSKVSCCLFVVINWLNYAQGESVSFLLFLLNRVNFYVPVTIKSKNVIIL